MKDNRLKQALNLIKQEYTERSDKDDPYHGGVMSNKTRRRYARLISMLTAMVNGKERR